MLKRVSDLLHSVERESRVLDAAEARALRNEIEGHLDAAIMARLEMGATPEEAEREAVAAFGDVRHIVRAMRPPQTAFWFDRRFFAVVGLGWLALYAAGYLGGRFFAAFSGTVNLVVIGLTIALVVTVVGMSLRARRVQLLPVVALFPLFTVLGAMGQASATLPASDTDWGIQRSEAEAQVVEFSDRYLAFSQALDEYAAQRRAFDQGALTAPVSAPLDKPTVSYEDAVSRAEALAAWTQADRQWKREADFVATFSKSRRDSLKERLAEPWYRSIGDWLGISATIALFPAALTLLLNMVVAFAGWLYRRLPRRGRTA